MFADDCILYRQINSPTDAVILQNDLKELENWEKVWKMKFNRKIYGINSHLEKTSIIEYYLRNHKRTTVTNVSTWVLHSTLSFNGHTDATCKKANSNLSFIQRT